MPEEQKKYRLILDFTVSINDEILQPYPDEDELDEEETIRLQSQRALLKGLLEDQQGILEEVVRKKVLEEADGAVDIYELKSQLLIRNLEDELLLEPILDTLVADEWNYFQEAREQETFEEAASEVLSSFGVELEGASLVEVDEAEEEEPRA